MTEKPSSLDSQLEKEIRETTAKWGSLTPEELKFLSDEKKGLKIFPMVLRYGSTEEFSALATGHLNLIGGHLAAAAQNSFGEKNIFDTLGLVPLRVCATDTGGYDGPEGKTIYFTYRGTTPQKFQRILETGISYLNSQLQNLSIPSKNLFPNLSQQ